MTARIAIGLTVLPIALAAAPALAAPALQQNSALGQHAGLRQDPAHPQSLVRRQEWWLGSLGVRQAWRVSAGAGITVAVLSDGVDASQSDLARSVITGPDFLPAATASGPWFGLAGTAAASLIAGHGHGAGGSQGIIGVAPAARILSVQVTLSPGDPLLARARMAAQLPAAIAAGIRYAVGQGASVIDLPLDPGQPGTSGAGARRAAGGSQAERFAVAFALRRGVVLVAPAGDDGARTDAANYPAAYPGVISVGAFNQNVVKARYSSHQPYVTLTAPGDGVIAATPGGYAMISSTAAASAIVAGLAALIRSSYPELTPAQVRLALIRGTKFRPPGGLSDGSGYGTANAAAALAQASGLAAGVQRAGSLSVSRTDPTPPAVAVRASSITPEVLKAGVIAAAILVVLLFLIACYAAARRRRARQATAAAAQWDQPAASRSAYAGTGTSDPLLAYFSSPPGGEARPPEAGLPAGWRAPGGLSGIAGPRTHVGAGSHAGPGSNAGAQAGLGAARLGSQAGPGGQGGTPGAGAIAGATEPHGPGSRGAGARTARPAIGPAIGPAPRPPGHPAVSGSPPWEPAPKPDSELPWTSAPAPHAASRMPRTGGPGLTASAGEAPWGAAPAPPGPGGGSIWDSASRRTGRPAAREENGSVFDAEPDTGRDQGSRPIYVWNPAASTENFPAVRPDSD